MQSRVVGMAIKRESRGPIKLLRVGHISQAEGLRGDHNGPTKSRRQVTVISIDQWREACLEISAGTSYLYLPWPLRRANICVSNINFHEGHVGKHLLLGPKAILKITGETRPCDRMEEVRKGLREALAKSWRGGVTCTVISDGVVGDGDLVTLI